MLRAFFFPFPLLKTQLSTTKHLGQFAMFFFFEKYHPHIFDFFQEDIIFFGRKKPKPKGPKGTSNLRGRIPNPPEVESREQRHGCGSSTLWQDGCFGGGEGFWSVGIRWSVDGWVFFGVKFFLPQTKRFQDLAGMEWLWNWITNFHTILKRDGGSYFEAPAYFRLA